MIRGSEIFFVIGGLLLTYLIRATGHFKPIFVAMMICFVAVTAFLLLLKKIV